MLQTDAAIKAKKLREKLDAELERIRAEVEAEIALLEEIADCPYADLLYPKKVCKFCAARKPCGR